MIDSSNSVGAQPARRLSLTLGFVATVVVLVGATQLTPWRGKIICKWRPIDVGTSSILDAIQSYKSVFGVLPAGDNRAVFHALFGQNPRRMPFLTCSAESISPEGELLDPWGTPYKVYFSGDGVIIRSAGPNKQFDRSADKDFDDYIR